MSSQSGVSATPPAAREHAVPSPRTGDARARMPLFVAELAHQVHRARRDLVAAVARHDGEAASDARERLLELQDIALDNGITAEDVEYADADADGGEGAGLSGRGAR